MPVLKWHTSWNLTQHMYMIYNLPSLHYIYSIFGIIDSLELPNFSPNGFIFVKAMNAVTTMHVGHHEISARIQVPLFNYTKQ